MRRCLLVFEPPDGGVADHVVRLASGLAEHGWLATVAGPPESVAYDALGAAGVSVRRLPFRRGLRHPLSDARVLAALTRLLRVERHDLLHAHSSKAGAVGRCAGALRRVPTVYTPHCFAFAMPSGRARRTLAIGVERALGRLTVAVVCVADHERGLALEHRIAAPERLQRIYNGTDACPDGVEPDAALAAFRGDAPLAACLTVLRPQKSIDTFLEAAPEVLRRVPDARLAVVGNGELRGPLELRARELGLTGKVGFFDFVAPPARQLASIDVYVLPSAWEAFPIAILEAMACGVPQVATAVGGTPEAVVDNDTGLLVAPRDPPALAAAIVELLLDPERRDRIGAAARARHAALFRTERMVAETAAIYDRVAAA